MLNQLSTLDYDDVVAPALEHAEAIRRIQWDMEQNIRNYHNTRVHSGHFMACAHGVCQQAVMDGDRLNELRRYIYSLVHEQHLTRANHREDSTDQSIAASK